MGAFLRAILAYGLTEVQHGVTFSIDFDHDQLQALKKTHIRPSMKCETVVKS